MPHSIDSSGAQKSLFQSLRTLHIEKEHLHAPSKSTVLGKLNIWPYVDHLG